MILSATPLENAWLHAPLKMVNPLTLTPEQVGIISAAQRGEYNLFRAYGPIKLAVMKTDAAIDQNIMVSNIKPMPSIIHDMKTFGLESVIRGSSNRFYGTARPELKDQAALMAKYFDAFQHDARAVGRIFLKLQDTQADEDNRSPRIFSADFEAGLGKGGFEKFISLSGDHNWVMSTGNRILEYVSDKAEKKAPELIAAGKPDHDWSRPTDRKAFDAIDKARALGLVEPLEQNTLWWLPPGTPLVHRPGSDGHGASYRMRASLAKAEAA